MPYESLARSFAFDDVASPEALSSGAPHYTLPPQADCPMCFRPMDQRNVGGLLAPIYKAVCSGCEPLHLSLAEAEAVYTGAVEQPRNHYIKAHG